MFLQSLLFTCCFVNLKCFFCSLITKIRNITPMPTVLFTLKDRFPVATRCDIPKHSGPYRPQRSLPLNLVPKHCGGYCNF